MRVEWFFMFLIGVVLLSSVVLADFEVDEDSSSVIDSYLGGEIVKGKINISFSDQTNGRFVSGFSGGAELLDVLENMSYVAGEDFMCSPKQCSDDYKTTSGAESNFTLSTEGKALYGFKLQGDPVNVVEMQIEISSSGNEASCSNQMLFDLLEDGSTDFFNTQASSEVCSTKNYGCFVDDDKVTGLATITDTRYCNRINVSGAPAYQVGADFTKTGAGGELSFQLFDVEGNQLGSSVEISGPSAPQINVTIPYSSQTGFEGFVCVRDKENSNKFKIRLREAENSCGTAGHPRNAGSVSNSDYDLFIRSMKYAPMGSLNLNNDEFETLQDEELPDVVNSYLDQVYGKNCSDGCIVPFSITNSEAISIDNVKMSYMRGGNSVEATEIYQITSNEFTIDSDFLTLDIEKMSFITPNVDGFHEFTIELNGREVISEDLEVRVGFDFLIGPQFALIGQRTKFKAQSVGGEEIVKSTWDFGDGTNPITVKGSEVDHTYKQESDGFEVEVSTENAKGDKSTKKFIVVVGEVEASVNLTLTKFSKRMGYIESDINEFPDWVQEELRKEIKLDELRSSINRLQRNYESARTHEEYIEIIEDLIELDVPYSITKQETGTLPGEIGFDKIKTSYIQEISDVEEIEDRTVVALNIIGYMDKSVQMVLEFSTIVAERDLSSDVILKSYTVELTPKADADEERAYLIIDYPLEDIDFAKNYDERAVGKGSYIRVNPEESQTYSFTIAGKKAPSVDLLGIYVSPEISKLGGGGKPFRGLYTPEGTINWSFLLIWMGVLLFCTLVVYIILQEWYKKHYENHLFKNPDDLYNIINYIYNMRRGGMNDKDIRKLLKDKRWKGEQLTYSFKKIDGRRTGMWEIPIFKSLENRKVKQEIQKKQRAPVDPRFIRRGRRGFVPPPQFTRRIIRR